MRSNNGRMKCTEDASSELQSVSLTGNCLQSLGYPFNSLSIFLSIRNNTLSPPTRDSLKSRSREDSRDAIHGSIDSIQGSGLCAFGFGIVASRCLLNNNKSAVVCGKDNLPYREIPHIDLLVWCICFTWSSWRRVYHYRNETKRAPMVFYNIFAVKCKRLSSSPLHLWLTCCLASVVTRCCSEIISLCHKSKDGSANLTTLMRIHVLMFASLPFWASTLNSAVFDIITHSYW